VPRSQRARALAFFRTRRLEAGASTSLGVLARTAEGHPGGERKGSPTGVLEAHIKATRRAFWSPSSSGSPMCDDNGEAEIARDEQLGAQVRSSTGMQPAAAAWAHRSVTERIVRAHRDQRHLRARRASACVPQTGAGHSVRARQGAGFRLARRCSMGTVGNDGAGLAGTAPAQGGPETQRWFRNTAIPRSVTYTLADSDGADASARLRSVRPEALQSDSAAQTAAGKVTCGDAPEPEDLRS
jgi:hypothetical protein